MAKLTVLAPEATPLAHQIDDFLQDRRAGGVSPKTIRIYRDALEGVLLPFASGRGIDQVNTLTDRLLNDLSVGLLDGSGSRSGRALSKDTVHSYTRAMNSFLAWASKEGQDVSAKAKAPKLGRRDLVVLSRAEVQAMEDVASTERDKLIIRILGDTGLRLNELLGITLADLRQDSRQRGLRVHGKGDLDRTVPLTPRVFERLRKYGETSKRRTGSDRVFLALKRNSRTGDFEPLTDSGVQQMIRDRAEEAGIAKRVYPHLLRHSFATDFLRKGGSPLLLQKILGHSSLAMITKTYSHMDYGDAHAEAMRILALDD